MYAKANSVIKFSMNLLERMEVMKNEFGKLEDK